MNTHMNDWYESKKFYIFTTILILILLCLSDQAYPTTNQLASFHLFARSSRSAVLRLRERQAEVWEMEHENS